MEGLLLLIVAMVVFALFIFLLTRAVKTIMFIGLIVVAVFVLKVVGVLR